jgi:transcription initiation factor TFIIH subunit 3
LPSQFIDGVAELIQQNHAAEDTAAMAAGLSLALCHVNRFLVAHQSGSRVGGGGVSALYHDPTTPASANDDKDVMSLIGNNNASTTKRRSAIQAGNWSPRILLIQASNDRSQDYNAFMNCTFAAVKQNIVLDGCFLPSGMGKDPKNSSFLEQACDRTGGIYLAPSGMAQVGPAWSELLIALFLAPRTARPALTRPNIPSVDFRARCFLTGNSVSIAHVCNQCLSIFQSCPSESCPTCGAPILNDKTMNAVTNGTK